VPQSIYDVAIVGAGPAGAAAATLLALHGARVILLEKEQLPRYKTCGGGLIRRAEQLLGVDVSPVAERRLCVATMNFLESGLSYQTSRPFPLLTMTMRAELDRLLVTYAQKAGASLAAQTKALDLTRSPSALELRTSAGAIAARFVIGADGVHSTVARAGGWPAQRALAPALESEICVPDEDFARFSSRARFDFDIPQHGYAWVFPKRAHLSVGLLTTARRDPNLPALLHRYLERVGLKRILDEQRHGFFIPVAVRAQRLAADRILLVGDAAGLADPVTAEGLSHAVLSGQLAARALILSQFESGPAEAAYNQLLRQDLLPELKAAAILSTCLYKFPRGRRWLFQRYGQQFVDAMTGILTGEVSYRQMLWNWRNYLKLLRFNGNDSLATPCEPAMD
jgi:geranylgeranyl reductase family protein